LKLNEDKTQSYGWVRGSSREVTATTLTPPNAEAKEVFWLSAQHEWSLHSASSDY